MSVYEIDDISINDYNKFWFYVVNDKIYDILFDNFESEKLYLSSYRNYNIKKNDIIIIYVKSNSCKIKTGIAGILQSNDNMIKNDDEIKIFKDKNINKYIIDFDTLISFDIIETNSFVHLIENSIFKRRSNMTKEINKGRMFLELEFEFGLELVKLCIRETDDNITNENITNENNTESVFDSNSDKSDDDEDKEDDNKEVDDKFNNSNYSDFTYNDISDDLSETSDESYYEKYPPKVKIKKKENKNSKLDIFKNLDNYEIVPNIPIMLIPCQKLLKNNKNKIKTKHIMDHIFNCQDCEITNNNNTHIKSTFNILSMNDIMTDFDECDYFDALDKYYELKPYSSENGEYIKIIKINDPEYENCFIIEYTSKIKKTFIKKIQK